MVTEKVFPDIDGFKEEIRELTKRFKNVRQFRLMGGEPFVNPDLRFFLYEVRKGFPYADIRIASNGLLIPQMSDETVEAIRECSAVIDISQYPPTRDLIDKILSFTQERQIEVQISGKITHFFKQINFIANEERESVYSKCVSRKCHFLRKGRLYCCGAPILFFENKDFLALNIQKKDVDNASFDLIGGNEDGWQILEKFLFPFDFCKYCTNSQWFEWCVSKKGEIKREDWIVESKGE